MDVFASASLRERQTDRQTDKQTDRQTDKRTDRQTVGQTDLVSFLIRKAIKVIYKMQK